MIRQQINSARELDPDLPWHHRGYLPHFDGRDVTQFVTFRLAGSIPKDRLSKLKLQLGRKQITDIEYHRGVEKLLDEGHGPDFLGIEQVAELVENGLLHGDGTKYRLLHWVIMPTHVHVLLSPTPGHSLSSILHSIKSFTANKANESLDRDGAFWAPEYYDRFIRDAGHYANTVSYIHRNPVKGHLCSGSAEWRFGCARIHE